MSDQYSPSDKTTIPFPYTEYVVLEVFSDPLRFASANGKKGIENLESFLKENCRLDPSLAKYVCINSVVAVPTENNPIEKKRVGAPVLLHPFFPPHLTLPVQRGEHIWGIEGYASFTGNNTLTGYWFCRVVAPYYVDDINHTHLPRIYDVNTTAPNNQALFGAMSSGNFQRKESPYHFANGMVDAAGNHVIGKAAVSDIASEESKFYEKLLQDSLHKEIINHRPVPQIKTRPGDMAISGTDNSMIRLGSDQASTIYTDDFKLSGLDQKAGAIDIVAGRGDLSNPNFVVSNSLNEKEIKKPLVRTEEIAKISDLNMVKDKSRIYIAELTHADKNFNLDKFNDDINKSGAGDLNAQNPDPAIVQKSDKIRIVARKNAEIVIVGPDDDKTDNYVAITFNSSGEIYLKTPKQIKLDAANVYVGNNSQDGQFIPLGDKLIDWLKNHTHPTGVGPTGIPQVTSPTQKNPQLTIDNLLSKRHKISDES